MTDDRTAEELREFIETQELIKADSAEPKSIQYFRQQGFRMVGARKFPGSRLQYTKKVKRLKKSSVRTAVKMSSMSSRHLRMPKIKTEL